MPVVVRGDGVGVDHDRQGGGRLGEPAAPELVVESGKQQRRGLARRCARRPESCRSGFPCCRPAPPRWRSSSICWRPAPARLRAATLGTSRRNCSVCRVTIGISITLSAIEPARPEKRFIGTTTRSRRECRRRWRECRSANRRRSEPPDAKTFVLELGQDRLRPEIRPEVRCSAATATISTLPRIALAMPPPVSPGGSGSLVKKFQSSELAAVVEQVAQNQKQDRRR